ncbi:heparinase II/III family protein [Frankia sp. R82]|uniref:heparinase II/III domain-containing protein n=1 Tax=Frankia sp. R82 TaxID=2950553 RepID=UPI002042E98C|nr:heparinase II/III family protein [Frankia sp. R82]MCM3884762.1 heparinase II/III family protein [Frankia sp. R82]
MSAPAEFGRYLRTVAHLRPGQIVARGRLRAQRVGLRQAPRAAAALLHARPSPAHWPAGFIPLDGRIALADPPSPDLAQNRITLLGHTRDLSATGRGGTNAAGAARLDWEQADAPLLWRYHLHYWDWAWTLAGDGAHGRAAFARLYLDWRAAIPLGHPVAWSPYVASLRAWTLCALHPLLAPAPGLAVGTTPGDVSRDAGELTALRDALRADLGTLHAYLRAHQETDVGGNHLLKNLKALIALEVAAGDRHGLRRRLDALVHQLDRQVLADGGHHERAPAYHCQVLADLDDLTGLLAATGRPVPHELADAATRMRTWLATVLGPDGTVPLLNDGYPVPDALLRRLLTPTANSDHQPPTPESETPSPRGTAAPRHTALPRNTAAPTVPAPIVGPDRTGSPARAHAVLLPDSGLAVLTAGDWHLLADVGLPCPNGLPAHAHADTLAFLLWLGAQPILVDPATSTYAPGPRRDRERGTAAHSTVTVDDLDSTEVWGAFRAGRRARPTPVALHRDPTSVTLNAGHDGYRRLPGAPHHQRLWRLDQHRLVLRDRIGGTGRHRITVHLHFAPGIGLASDTTLPPACARSAPTNPARPAPPLVGSVLVGRPTLVTPLGRRLELYTDLPGRWRLHLTPRAIGWERTVPAVSAEFSVDADLPITLRTTLGASGPPGPDTGDPQLGSALDETTTRLTRSRPAPSR